MAKVTIIAKDEMPITFATIFAVSHLVSLPKKILKPSTEQYSTSEKEKY